MRPDAFMTIMRNNAVIATGETTDPEANSDPNTPSGIEILSFSQTVAARPNHRPGQGGSNAIHAPIRILKPVDNASPKLQDLVEKAYTDLVIYLAVMHRKGTSSQTSDQWSREALLDFEFEQARVTSVQVVLDPRVHGIADTMWPSEVLDVGPLEEITVEYKKYEMTYGASSNKVSWTYQEGGAN